MSTPNVEDVYGLSPMQSGMLFHSLRDGEGTNPYQVQMVEKITGPFDDEPFLDAWQRVVDRHSILRSAFVWEDVSTPVQVVQRRAELPREALDWRGAGPAEQDARLERLAAEDREQGFDLSRPPLLRVRVIRTADECRVILWSFHHILLDGWSIQLIKNELFAIYRAAVEGREPVLPPAIPYVRYATWLHEQPSSQAREFWRGYLKGMTEPPELTTARSGTGTGMRDHETSYGAELSQAVRRFAREQRITVNTVVQGVWSALLARYTGHDDVLFGATTAGRSAALAGIESMVGLFINTLPVRVRVDGGATVADWLRDLQTQQIDLRQWEYSHLVDVQECSDVPRGRALFQSILVFENYPDLHGSDSLPEGVDVRPVNCVEHTGYPLTVVVSADDVLDVKFAYDRALFDAETIDRLARHFQTLLEGFVAAPRTRLSDVGMLTEAERERILLDWNDTDGPFPEGRTMHGLVAEQAAATPDDPAVICGDRVLTHKELNVRSNRLAHFLRGRGVGPDVLVAVFLDRSPELIVALLAIQKAGGAFVPLDPEYPVERLAYMLEDTAAPLVITQTALAGLLPGGTDRFLIDEQWPAVEECPATDPEPLAGSRDLAYVIYTSGSTGKPKGVMIEHEGAVNYLHWCDQAYPPVGDVGTLLYSPVAFDLTITALFLPLMQGMPVVVPVPQPGESAFAAAVEHLLSGTSVSFLKMTPSHAELLVTSAETTGTSLNVNTMVLGGEELTAELARRILAVCEDTVIYNEYGATECSVANVMSATREVDVTASGGVSVGSPITNTTAYVVDAGGEPVPVGVAGECLLGGICVARGYLNRPELTEERFIWSDLGKGPQRLYRTGDLCRWLPNGELEFIGRIDTQVKLRGYRIELGEIEATLIDHPDVATAAVIVREDTPGVQRLTAYVVPGATEPAAEDLKARLARTLPSYMVPAAYVTLPALPLTPNGKTDRDALPAPATAARETTPPSTDTEHLIAGIWSDILGTTEPGVHDDFFDLGGHSLLAIKVTSRLRRAGRRTTLQQVMAHPTIHELAKAVSGAAREQTGLISEVRRAVVTELPNLFCIHPGGGQVYSYRTLADELKRTFRVLGVQATGLADGETPLEDVRAMAERYWKEIANVQPEGPYRLLGWSTGAVILHEMALMHPEEVRSAFLLEPAVTGTFRKERFDGLAAIFGQAEMLWRRGQDETGPARERTERELKLLAGPMNIGEDAVDLAEWLPYNVLRAEARALADYRATPSHARATLVVSDEIRRAGQELMPAGDRERYVAHWAGLYPGGLRVIDLPGGHHDMIETKEAVAAVTAALTG
ncbi:amino acid adenylation domain-containing protein [Actinomadura sp. DC4]|uniref:amino acid adenylation domain-containing protein n=1 Tax=Actinomadura sp. DC4 TaxID=3055069 RepID=UPI0025AFE990|nr:amino acid adenylation domain-containing protein [Actinomadura sp. DC4]MDN3356433.1 amino acid adenylation domain-containing protein [Actinomadura sp. DC4]